MAENYFNYPDETIFHGITDNSNGFTFLEARALAIDDEKLFKLKERLSCYYLTGLKELGNPFTIAVLTCMGIEVLGQVILGFNSKGDTIDSNTILIYEMLDSKMQDVLSPNFALNYNLRRNITGQNIDFTLDFTSYARVVRKGLRNAFTHTYRSLGVFLDAGQSDLLLIDENIGCLIINPIVFRERFLSVFEKTFSDLISNVNPIYRQNALIYFNLLIKQ
ncbi:MAG: hypothetical protein A2033_11835 [Bacteroidetes bacterium GWA2_31_9]|nr:MAG: hypothetical protein A2033_11835 [Bacteroidetes bacterium GWA2_31_9]